MRDIRLLLSLAVALSACGTGTASSTTLSVSTPPGAASPAAAVDELMTMTGPDFAEVAHLAMPGHAALASLAEGASVADVAAALQDGDVAVASNFWAGFAQGSGGILSGGEIVDQGASITQDSVQFELVTVVPSSGLERVIVLRESDGYRVDLFASFGAGLADRMIEPVERLLSNQTPEARFVISELQTIVPSLKVAAQLPGTSTPIAQQLLALVEVITRIG